MRGIDKVLNEVYYYGGLPLRLGDIIADMDEKAKELDKEHWFNIREAGLSGLMSFNKFTPLNDVEPLTLSEFHNITGFEVKGGCN